MSEQLLRLDHITMQFGGVVAVDNLNLEVNEGEIVALIGPNGAGKTTAFNCITGVYEPTNGKVEFYGEPIVESFPRGKMKKLYAGENADRYHQHIVSTPDAITKRGIARTFQNIRLFKAMTVLDNVKIAFTKDIHYNLADSLLRTKRYWNTEQELTDKAMEYLRIVHLDDKAGQLASSLPYGQQRKLEIARALATNMKLLLLDEPAAGMNPTETAELLSCINTIRDTFHVAILLIEHDMSLVMRVCERIQVINFGQTIAVGLPSEIASNQEVIEAYLGEEEADDDAED